MRIRRRTSKRSRVASALTTYLKFKAIAKLTKGARKTVVSWGAYKAAKQAPTPVKALPVVAGLGVAGAAVAVKRRSSGEPAEPVAA
jgi:hypothetical protein